MERTEWPGDTPGERGLRTRQHGDAGEGCAEDTVLCPRKMQIYTPTATQTCVFAQGEEFLRGLGKSHSIAGFFWEGWRTKKAPASIQVSKTLEASVPAERQWNNTEWFVGLG